MQSAARLRKKQLEALHFDVTSFYCQRPDIADRWRQLEQRPVFNVGGIRSAGCEKLWRHIQRNFDLIEAISNPCSHRFQECFLARPAAEKRALLLLASEREEGGEFTSGKALFGQIVP